MPSAHVLPSGDVPAGSALAAPTRTVAPSRRTDELGVAGAAALAGDYTDDLVLGTIRDVHRAVADRVFGATNRVTNGAARVPQAVHARVSAGVFAAVGAALKGASAALRAVERRDVGPRLESHPAGRHVLSAVNGFVGDRLKVERPELAIEMAVRRDGRDVPLTAGDLRAAFPEATEDVAVFVHGLGENDDFWSFRRAELGGTYGTRLTERTSWTPVYLRANTGLPLAENGISLASLMAHLVQTWPTPVRRVALVGHSMGGLIVRAACAADTTDHSPDSPDSPAHSPAHSTAHSPADSPAHGPAHSTSGGAAHSSPGGGAGRWHRRGHWTDLVTDVVTLGTPHLGAPLERVVHAGARALGVLPESAPFGRILEYRSVGILDLRRGLAADVRHLPHARYRLVAATLAKSHQHPVSEVLGDLLVRYPSAVGRARRSTPMFPDAEILHVPGTDHFGLLNHPDVADALERWLD